MDVVARAHTRAQGQGRHPNAAARAALDAITDPALGENAYVRLGDVLDLFRRNIGAFACAEDALKMVEREHREGRLR